MKRSANADAHVVVPSPDARGLPQAAQVLVPVWGQSYIRQFLQFGLPTLLSPGNLPYIASRLPCQLVILTSSEDRASITDNPLVHRLPTLGCELQVRAIDHLITNSNQSTTITLAITEAIVASGEAMLGTCFFVATSDYIYAAGSLKGVLDRMLAGSSAVLVGNFQVAIETALPSLSRILDWTGQAPALPPRQLMRWALGHLHPATIANMVNVPFNHNAHTNRLFWRVDETTLLGRFYLRHPICIRPETTEFVIGSSLDYSYIPEMCPSGNVTSITDSDDYLVIEMQPRDHEASLLRFGPLTTKALAKSLAGWTTKEHRANVADVHVYHSREISSHAPAVRQEADSFVAAVASRLKHRPLPHRAHPYWKGAIAAFAATRPPESRASTLEHVYGFEQISWRSRWWWRRQYLLYGRPPTVYPWDPRWPDYAAVRAELRAATGATDARLLLVSNRPTVLSVALSSGAQVQRVRTESLARNPPLGPRALGEPFQACLVELSDSEVTSARALLARLHRYLVPGSHILVLANLTHMSAMRLAVLSAPGVSFVHMRLVPTSSMRQVAYRTSRLLHHFMDGQPWFGLPLALALGPPMLGASMVGNLLAVKRRQRQRRKVYGYSAAIMVFEVMPHDGRTGRGASGSSEDLEVSFAGGARTAELTAAVTGRDGDST
jgi:hypothetical protein